MINRSDIIYPDIAPTSAYGIHPIVIDMPSSSNIKVPISKKLVQALVSFEYDALNDVENLL